MEIAHMRPILGVILIGLVVCGCGGGSSSPAGAGSTPGAAPKLVQMNTFQTTGSNNANDSSVQFKSLTMAGDTIWVAVTVSDFGGVHAISVTDTQGNSYALLDQENDGAPGTQTVAHFYAANIVGDASTPDIVTVAWDSDNYKGVLITEISGATRASLAGHRGNIQDALNGGSDNVTSGPIEVTSAQIPALLVALSMNTSGGSSDTGGSGSGGPAAASDLTQVATLWNWGTNLATFATRSINSSQSVTSLFSAPDLDSYVTVAAVFY
jgi:hypothetical protein